MKGQSERVEWRGNDTPVSALFDDPYFSIADGLAETRHVYLAGNALPERFRAGFRVAELGFGTGLNLVATLTAWRHAQAGGTLHYTSFEAYPMPADDMARALASFPEISAHSGELLSAWRTGKRQFFLGSVCVDIIAGDARDTLPDWAHQADAWYLDGFSPAKNPELWQPALLCDVARHTATNGTFATYSAAGFIRRGLQSAGFQVERAPGYGRKRHMSRGILGPTE